MGRPGSPWVAKSPPEDAGQALQPPAELRDFRTGGVAGAFPPGGRRQETRRWFFPGWRPAGAGLSVLGPVGAGGGHEPDAGPAAAPAAAAAAEAALGGQRAGDAGGAGLAHEHRAAPAAPAQRVPAAHDNPGTAQAGATGAASTDAAAGEGAAATGQGAAGDHGLGPAQHAAPGAAHRCGRKGPSGGCRVPRAPHRATSAEGPRSKWALWSVQPIPTFSPLVGVTRAVTPLQLKWQHPANTPDVCSGRRRTARTRVANARRLR